MTPNMAFERDAPKAARPSTFVEAVEKPKKRRLFC